MLARSTTATLARSRLASLVKPNHFRITRISPVISASLTSVDFRRLINANNQSFEKKCTNPININHPLEVMSKAYFSTLNIGTIGGSAIGIAAGVADAFSQFLSDQVPLCALPIYCTFNGIIGGMGGLVIGGGSAMSIGIPLALGAGAITAIKNRSINTNLFSQKSTSAEILPSETPKEESTTLRPRT